MRLEIHPQYSAYLAKLIVFNHLGAALCVIWVELSLLLDLLILFGILLSFIWQSRYHLTDFHPLPKPWIFDNNRLLLTDNRQAYISHHSYVSTWLIVVRVYWFRSEADYWWRSHNKSHLNGRLASELLDRRVGAYGLRHGLIRLQSVFFPWLAYRRAYLLILPDSIPHAEFERLRVYLKYMVVVDH